MQASVECDTVVVGAGAVGLAVARELAMRGDSVIVLEAEPRIGEHTSSRNSEVIHAGLYYATGSLKARLCVRGKELLYRYCAERAVPFQRVGKLIIAATPDEEEKLAKIKRQGEDNGVFDLTYVSGAEVNKLEPAVQAALALMSPSTGIFDSHAFMTALKIDLEEHGGIVQLRTRCLGAERDAQGFAVRYSAQGEEGEIRCQRLINSAGLWAPTLALALGAPAPDTLPRAHFAKGHYFYLRGENPFRHLVYPLPGAHGLGVHVTLDLAGRARFGPDVGFVDGVDYDFDESRAPQFVEAIKRYYPSISLERLTPGYVGIRPKLGPASAPASDFVISGPAQHGIPGLVNLLGIESPGLTSSLALAQDVSQLV